MNSLKFKILGLAALIMLVAVGLSVWHNLGAQQAILSQVEEQNGRMVAEIVRNSIITNMAAGQNQEVAGILEKIGSTSPLAAVMIFDETGRILMSSKREEIGELVPTRDLLAFRANRISFEDTTGEQPLFKTVLPIPNAPACHGCHTPDKPILGILGIHLSAKDLAATEIQARRSTLLSSLAMLAVLITVLTGFVLFYVDTPIRRLVRAMTRVEQGEFDTATIVIDSSDEMAQLAEKFNCMVGRLKQQIENTVKHERELTVTQQQLVHQDEIQNMNLTLEERLREIEYLNISLEERIEEIEEANYKITDLASNLESKNTTLEEAVARLSALYRMGLAINSTMELDKLFDLLIHKALETLKAHIGYILLLERGSQTMRIGAAIGVPDDLDRELHVPLKPGGVSFWVVENRQPILIQNLEESRDFCRISRLGFTRESVICAPLIIKDEVIGTITIANRVDGSPLSSEDLELLSTIAAQATVAIKNAQLYEEQQVTYLSTTQALVSAVEASDPYTRGHSERVTYYSLALARHLKLTPESCKRLEQAAVLHDIGKIGIGMELLHKQGQLTPEDIRKLQKHPLIGVRILEPIIFLDGVREVILQHHERPDGLGYPHRLLSGEILVEAHVLAVVDTYDAMTSDRPYRKALSHEIALQEIRDYAGTQFDAQVAAAFIELCASGGLRA